MTKLFVDTSGLFAAMVRNDFMHVRAAATLSRAVADAWELHTTSYVLAETTALLQARVGLPAALDLEDLVRPRLVVTWIDEASHQRAVARLRAIGARGVSLVDCASFVAMEAGGIAHVFGYDEDFATQGFRLVGTPDALA